VNGQTLQERYVQLLLDRVRQDPYPSPVQMDLIEATIRDSEQLVDYIEALLEKVESTRFPSLSMLRRIQRIASILPG
jgi:hypothetical protein